MLGLVYHSGGGYASVGNGGLLKNFHKFFVVFQGFYSLYFGMFAQKKPLCSDIFRFYHFIPLFMICSPFVHSARCPIFRTGRFQAGSSGCAGVCGGQRGPMGTSIPTGHFPLIGGIGPYRRVRWSLVVTGAVSFLTRRAAKQGPGISPRTLPHILRPLTTRPKPVILKADRSCWQTANPSDWLKEVTVS